jgi:type IV pilus assembly protein PilV
MMSNLSLKITAAGPQRGMTLIEILVAVVVLSVGLLGLAGLQLKGMQVNQGSTYRWEAAVLAEDLADRIRADRANAAAYVGSYGPGSAPTGAGAAATDWAGRLAALPGAGATIAEAATATGNSLSITVSWNDARANAGSGTSTPGAFVLTTWF